MKTHVLNEMKAAGMPAAEVEQAFEAVTQAMGRVIERGDRVRIPNIGTLVRKTRAATNKRNPRTGEAIAIAERDQVALRNPRRF